MMFGFDNPAAFFLLLFIPVIYFLRYLKILSGIYFPLNLGDWNGRSFLWNKGFRKILSATVRVFVMAAYVLLVTALADPVMRITEKVYTSRGSDIVFVVDVSPSMAARDIGSGQRLDAAKAAIKQIAASNSGDSFGLVEMAQTAALVVPPTMDRKSFFSRLDSLAVGELGDGTAIGTGLSCAVYHLENSSSPKKSIVLMTDGENNSGSVHPHTAAKFAASKGISLYVLGIGKRGTVPLEYSDPKTGHVYSGYLESKFDGTSLSKIAAEGEGKYFEIDSMQSLSQSVSSVSKNENVVQTYFIKNNDRKLYFNFIVAAAVLCLLAWILRRLFLQEVL